MRRVDGSAVHAVIRDGSDVVHDHGAVNNHSDVVHDHGAVNNHRVDGEPVHPTLKR
jgi:hypothetical protein